VAHVEATAEKICTYFTADQTTTNPTLTVLN
jgi:hypothetical protein